MVNRFVDMALFYDTGKVTAAARPEPRRPEERRRPRIPFHGPLATPLRIEFAKGNEGLSLVFAASAAF